MDLVLTYHRVRRGRRDPWGLDVAPEHFAGHLAVLHELTRVVPLAGLLGEAANRRPRVALTFDDGYRDVLTAALPLLERTRTPATLFLVGETLHGRDEHWWDELARRGHEARFHQLAGLTGEARAAALADLGPAAGPPADEDRPLRAAEVARLAAHPLITLGSHTASHPSLPRLAEAEQEQEIRRGRELVAEVAGHDVDAFAFPFGHHTPGAHDLLRRAGVAIACTQQAGPLEPLALPRLSVGDVDAREFRRRLTRRLEQP